MASGESSGDVTKITSFPESEASGHSSRLREPARLESLADSQLIDSLPEEPFDRAVRLVKALTGAPTALFSLVDDRRQFFKAQLGLELDSGPIQETPLSHSFCQYVVSQEESLGVSDARLHPMLQKNRAVNDLYVVAYLGVPVRGRRGQVIGSLCAIDSTPHVWTAEDQRALEDVAMFLETEIALRKNVAERQLLIDELNHRIGNLFAIVNGIVRLGRRDGLSADEFASRLQDRIQALASTHHLLAPISADDRTTGREILLNELLASLVKPYIEDRDGRVRFNGPEVSIGSISSAYLALAVHELTTNAIKYGALSVADAQLLISWSVSNKTLRFTWEEIGPKSVGGNAGEDGFGTKLIQVCIENQLNGALERRAAASTFSVTALIPQASLAV